MICLYHNDPDGKASAFVVKKTIESSKKYSNYTDEEKYYEMDYTKRFPFDDLKDDELVIIVDFSISPVEMKKVCNKTTNIIWIDHHYSVIEKYKKYPEFNNIKGIRFDGISACLLTYIYFCLPSIMKVLTDEKIENREELINNISNSNYIPMWLKLINDWDVMRLNYVETIPFMYYCNSRSFRPDDLSEPVGFSEFKFNSFYDPRINEAVREGKFIQRYVDIKNKENCERNGFAINFEGLNVFVLNTTEKGSIIFDNIKDKDKYDAFIVFNFNGSNYNYSIYSTKVDCSKIASKYGGGGHKGASGFSSDRLVFFD